MQGQVVRSSAGKALPRYAAMLAMLPLLLAGSNTATPARAASVPRLEVVASTNVYSDVVLQLGRPYVSVTGILNDPNIDPHTYESSTSDAAAVATAAIVVQNGIGYDDFMDKLESASPNSNRVVIDVGQTLGYKNGDNPHLWYNPSVMPKVASKVVAALSRRDPAHKIVFERNLMTFNSSLRSWTDELKTIRTRFSAAPVAVTEPVFDYALEAMGLNIRTPFSFQQAIMGGTDPAPQDVSAQKNLFTHGAVKLFCYNQQAVAPITRSLLDLAHTRHIPVVGVYETRPPAKSFQQWMVAEARAVELALAKGISTEQIH